MQLTREGARAFELTETHNHHGQCQWQSIHYQASYIYQMYTEWSNQRKGYGIKQQHQLIVSFFIVVYAYCLCITRLKYLELLILHMLLCIKHHNCLQKTAQYGSKSESTLDGRQSEIMIKLYKLVPVMGMGLCVASSEPDTP